jgi:hypothetical protein
MEPFDQLDSAQLAARMPASAKKDLLEWADSQDASAYLAKVVTNEYSLPLLLKLVPDTDIQITDDRPFNEYYLLRQLRN